MFFENLGDIPKIVEKNGCNIIVVPDDTEVNLRNAFVLQPEEKTTITIEQVRNILSLLTTKQRETWFIIVWPADKLGEEAENAILKNLEEPQENVHWVLATEKPSQLLPTILSRAAVNIWRGSLTPMNEIRADDKLKALAKELLSAKPTDLTALAEKLTKKKDGVRNYVLNILEVAIEMGYKTYFATGKAIFLQKTEKLLKAHEAISQNGHIKLHLVADLL